MIHIFSPSSSAHFLLLFNLWERPTQFHRNHVLLCTAEKKIFFIKWRFLPSYHFHTQSFESVHHKSKTNPNNLIKSVRLISIFAFSHIFFPHSLFHPHFISNLRMTWHFLVQRFPFCCSSSFNFHKLLCFWLNKAPPILIFFLQTFLTLNWHSCNFGLNGKLRVHFN